MHRHFAAEDVYVQCHRLYNLSKLSPPPFFTSTILSDVYKSRSSVSRNIPNSSFTSFPFGSNIFLSIIFVKYLQFKLKVISPITGLRCLEGSRKLRFPDFVTTVQDGGKVVCLTHRPLLPQGNTPITHFC